MEKKVFLTELFPAYEPETELREVLEKTLVRGAELNPERRRIEATLLSEQYITLAQLNDIQEGLKNSYRLSEVAFLTEFGETAFTSEVYPDLVTVLTQKYPAAIACLAGCTWEREGEVLHLQLQANGVDELRLQLPVAEQYIREKFGLELKIEPHVGQTLTDEELFQKTSELRNAAMKSVAAPTVTKPKPKEYAIFGNAFRNKPMPMEQVSLDSERVCVEGEVFRVLHRELTKRKAWVISFYITDRTGSVWVNSFMEDKEGRPLTERIIASNPEKHVKGSYLRILGRMTINRGESEAVLQPLAIMEVPRPTRTDTAEEKRVELHLHTRMSAMDALTDTTLAVKQAAEWGHKAIAITDHGVAQSFPEALHAAEGLAKAGKSIKILYGCEGYYVNDVDDRIVVHGTQNMLLSDEYIAFDLETTGLSAQTERIIEIGAVRMKDGQELDRFESFVTPGKALSDKITELTGITDELLKGAPPEDEAIPAFLRFCGNRPLVAHNADFDIGFVTAACERLGLPFTPTYIDTLILAQNLLPMLSKHKLDTVAAHLSLPEFNHHRAADDALTCGLLYHRFATMLAGKGVADIRSINDRMPELRSGGRIADRHLRHIILFAKNSIGLRNLYRLISDSNLKYFKRYPRIPKSELLRWREGVLIGSACEAGELFQAIISHKSHAELKRIASFYDFLEIQPLSNNMYMLAKGLAENEEELREYNRVVVRLGEELKKPVVATGDVHFLDPEDEIFRHILLATKSFEDCDRPNPLYFRTTDDMLREFAYLGEEKALEVVVTNTNLIADMCDSIRPVPYNLFAPKIENSVEDLKSLVYTKLHKLYGENPPELITKRVETELGDIIRCHYDVIYMSAQKLVQDSLAHGYLVGSRGSVGSSLVAYMSGITEVNSLPPHYRCPKEACKYTTFEIPEGINCGADLPDAVCPKCGTKFEKDGFNIPFETFLGFGGEKVPDIDLNFSSEYQAKAHAYCRDMFGASHVFRAGTIGTVAEKTAYGYAKKFLAERSLIAGRAEEDRLAAGCVGVRRTTGQHPGGLVVIPQENEIYDFCPVQHPADDPDSEWTTTHFEYHSMEENLLKLDMLGHDDPTMIRMLEDMTGVKVGSIPLDDKDTMSIFTSSKVLGYENDPLLGDTGAVGIPEFGTGFTRGMLKDTMPSQFDTLLRLSGFSHGTNVWVGNAKDLILSGTATVGEAIGCRDDIMIYLIRCGLPELRAFKIMEGVRKGKGLQGAEKEMSAAGVPEWYIESCRRIKYLFPKAHAVAYVMMAFRIAWYKVHYPLAYYSAYFYRRSQKGGFDAAMMCRGKETVLANIKKIQGSEDATDKDDGLLTTLEVCYEFYLRGFSFDSIDLYESDAVKFIPRENKLLPPFIAVTGLGDTAAYDLVAGRQGREFISIEEVAVACPKVSQTHIENLKAAGAFRDLPERSQFSLFD